MSEQETITMTRAEKRSRRTTTLIGLVVAAILILIIGSFVLMISAGVTGTVRDVIIILLELESLIVVALLLVLVYQVTLLVKMMREEIKPLIESAQETVASARGTTTFVSKKIVTPTVSIASTLAGVGRMISFVIKGK
jgi:membrane protein implicated in regulation of membrane protease activity